MNKNKSAEYMIDTIWGLVRIKNGKVVLRKGEKLPYAIQEFIDLMKGK